MTPLIERLAVIGTGLVGGSIGLGLRRAGVRVTGWDADARTLERALERGAVDEAAAGPEEAVIGAELVVLAAPTDAIPGLCEVVARALGPRTVVTDVGSAKAEIAAAGEAAAGERFVGGHPMAGSERHGIEAADEALFEDAWWLLTPTGQTSPRAYGIVAQMATALGARPVAVDPRTHDALVARLSHVPQLAASAVVNLAVSGEERAALLGVAGPGFRDVTRIAASSPELWTAILRSNRAAVLQALRALRDALGDVEKLVDTGCWDELREWLAQARRARLELFAKEAFAGEPAGLTVLVPDRPGVLAEVTTAAGELGVNIEDLRIVHSTEGGRGRLELIISGPEAADLLASALRERGYRPERMEIET